MSLVNEDKSHEKRFLSKLHFSLFILFFAELQLYPTSLKYSLITSLHPTLSAEQSNHANIAHVILTHLLKDAVEGYERNQLSSFITFIFRFHQLKNPIIFYHRDYLYKNNFNERDIHL